MSYKRSIETKRRLKRLLLKTERYYGAGAYLDSRKNRIGIFLFFEDKKCRNKKSSIFLIPSVSEVDWNDFDVGIDLAL